MALSRPAVGDGRGPGAALRTRRTEATLDEMRGDYQNRSGVHRSLDRDLRRELLTAIAWIQVTDSARLRDTLHAIDVSFRRKDRDWVGAGQPSCLHAPQGEPLAADLGDTLAQTGEVIVDHGA